VKAGRRPPRFPLEGSESNPLETLGFALIGAIVVAGAALWLVGELSGRVFGGAWPSTGAAEMGGVLARFAGHASDPSHAWPPRDRTPIPGPLAFYGTLAFVLAPPLTLTLIVLRRRLRTTDREGGARWAGRRDLRPLVVHGPTKGRLTLGIADGRLVAAEPRQSVIVVGPVQTGKTSGFAVPAILEWQGPVVATSVKTDLLRDTIAARESIPDSHVWIYDPTGGTGYPAAGWTPLAGCDTWEGAQRVASWLAAGAQPRSAGLESAEFWYAAAAKLLAPLLFAAAATELTMADVVRWVDSQPQEEIFDALAEMDEPAAVTAFHASTLRDDRTRSGIYTTAETVLAAYADPGVLASAATSDLRAELLLDGGHHTAYLCAPAHEQRRLQPLFATLVQEIVACAYDRATETGQALNPPLLVVLDECANIAPLRDLATLASTGAGQGIQLVSVFQDMGQVNSVYGRDRANTIVSNHRAKVILSGVADVHTFDYVGRLLGDEEVRQISSTSGDEGRRSTTESVAYRSLAPANVLREMRPGHGLLVYGHLPPARLALRPWFEDRELRGRAAGIQPVRELA
jgi:type IV secretion system protein VirD4